MKSILALFSFSSYISPIKDLAGWIGLAILALVIVQTLVVSRKLNQSFSPQRRYILLWLLISVPITNLFMGVLLPAGQAMHQPGLAEDPIRPAILFFSSIPWLLAAGMLGPVYAAILAFISGLLRAYWHTHHIFTPFITTLLAILLSICFRQTYRTRFFQLIRRPLAAIIPVGLLYAALQLLVIPLTITGALVNRVDYAISLLPGFFIAQIVELLIAAFIGEAFRRAVPSAWVGNENLQPSPAERSLQTRFLLSMSPLAIILMITLMAGAWFQAGRTAQRMLRERMANTAQVAADHIPLFLETGQQMLSLLAQDVRLQSNDLALIQSALSEDVKTIPFFDHLVVLDSDGSILSKYPDNIPLLPDFEKEKTGIQLALTNRFTRDYFAISPIEGQTATQISFITAIPMGSQPNRAVLARANLTNNPISKTILSSMNEFSGEDGQGLLIDEDNHILAHPDPDQVMELYTGPVSEEPGIFGHISPTGTRQYVYYQPVDGSSWSIALIVPAARSQQIAVDIAGPLLAMIVFLAILGIFITRVGLGVVTSSLQTLATQAGRIAQGHLDHPLAIVGEDEVGRLSRVFEQMRLSLKSRLDELNRLLIVSQSVASTLEVSEAIQPILESALSSGASVSRVVLLPAVVPELDGSESTPIHYSLGSEMDAYHELDEQILTLTRQQDRLVLSNINRPRLIDF